MQAPDRIADNIERLILRQRRQGKFDQQWTKLRPGQCCLCGSDGSEVRKLRDKLRRIGELVEAA